jgi:hypothetical protein
VALKKPSEYFNKKEKVSSIDNKVQELIQTPELNTFSDAFESFKRNLNKIETISEFSETLDNYAENIEKVNFISNKVEDIQKEIQTLLKKEDLDRAMMSQLLVVESSIRDIQSKVQGINEKNLTEIRLDVSGLATQVNEFIEVEVPKYKKLVVDTEIRTYNRYEQLEENVNQALEGIGEFVDAKYEELTETLEGINEKSVSEIIDNFETLNQNFNQIKENDIPKYKDFIVETELRTESKLNEFDEKLNQTIEGISNKIDSIENSHQIVEQRAIEKIEEIEFLKNEFENELKNNETYKESITQKVSSLEVDILRNEKHLKTQSQYIEDIQEELNQRVSNLKEEILQNENVVKQQNQYIEDIQEEIQTVISKLHINEIEEQNYELSKKVKYLEEIFKKFNEQNLTEGLLNEPPDTKNSDPLTPLDKKFVTLDQLQQHYRLFINRIQQQLSTLGGGGETRLKYLDDVVGIATNPSAYDGKYLKYNHSSGNFVFDNIAVAVGEENVIYVAKDGNDSNFGDLTNPKLTIKAAVNQATAETVIRVAPGTYIEDNPIVLPDQVTIIGHSLRETTVIPMNDNQDLFYLGNGNYVAEMSFKGTLLSKAVFAFDPNNKRYINQSPYVQNCTNFIPDSVGMRIDGRDAIGPLKSMVLDSYTQYNQGGIGVSITNEAYAQLVSLFTICNDIAVYCGSGGACDLTNSNSSFGNYGLVADGVSAKKFSGITTVPSAENSDTFVVQFNSSPLNVVNAVYDNTTGLTTITVNNPHNFNVGMGISISGLGFTCSSGPGIVTYPSGNQGYIFNVSGVPSSTSFEVYVGISTLSHTYNSGGTARVNVVRPFDGQAVYFNDLFYTVKTLNIVDGGSGYTDAPTITIDPPDLPWGVVAQASPIIENGSLVGVDMISNGRGYTSIPNVTVSSGINTAVVTAELVPEYYTIQKATEVVGGISIITLNENVPFSVGVGTTVNFFKQSRILASGHSFEFIGSGTDIATCLPFTGGVPTDENETDSREGGLVVYTSTNQAGNFKIGDGVTINQTTGSITGNAYTKSLLSTMTPYILSLGGF